MRWACSVPRWPISQHAHDQAERCPFECGDLGCVGPAWHAGEAHQNVIGELFVIDVPPDHAKLESKIRAKIKDGVADSRRVLMDLQLESGRGRLATRQEIEAAFGEYVLSRFDPIASTPDPHTIRGRWTSHAYSDHLAGVVSEIASTVALDAHDVVSDAFVDAEIHSSFISVTTVLSFRIGQWSREWTIPHTGGERYPGGRHRIPIGRQGGEYDPSQPWRGT